MAKKLGLPLGCGATLILLLCLLGEVVLTGGSPFSPGALSAEHTNDQLLAHYAAHADFETRCDLCHAPFQGPTAELCAECHTDVREQIETARGIHSQIRNPRDCAACHTDHKGRAASMTRITPDSFPHNQFGFTLINHQRDYANNALTCHTCHTTQSTESKLKAVAVLTACVDCHQTQDAKFVADHRKKMGEACVACHDGTDRLKGFNHKNVYALEGKHAPVACAKCHVNDRFKGTPKDCAACHPDPKVHQGQFGIACAACHTVAGWQPARLIKHTFPINHGNKGKDSDCKVCHTTNYVTYTCYGCHDHTANDMTTVHRKANMTDFQNCVKCHATGKTKE